MISFIQITLLRWSIFIMGLMAVSLVYYHYHLQSQTKDVQRSIENLNIRLLATKDVQIAEDNSWILLEKMRVKQIEIKKLLQTISSARHIFLRHLQINNRKLQVTASSHDSSGVLLFMNSLKDVRIKSIHWDELSHSVIFQFSSSFSLRS